MTSRKKPSSRVISILFGTLSVMTASDAYAACVGTGDYNGVTATFDSTAHCAANLTNQEAIETTLTVNDHSHFAGVDGVAVSRDSTDNLSPKGKLTFLGDSDVIGTVGSNSIYLNTITAGASEKGVNFHNDVYAALLTISETGYVSILGEAQLPNIQVGSGQLILSQNSNIGDGIPYGVSIGIGNLMIQNGAQINSNDGFFDIVFTDNGTLTINGNESSLTVNGNRGITTNANNQGSITLFGSGTTTMNAKIGYGANTGCPNCSGNNRFNSVSGGSDNNTAVFEKDILATIVNVIGTGTLKLKGNTTADLFFQHNGTATLENKELTGAITTNNDNTGTLYLIGSSSVSGAIGTAGIGGKKLTLLKAGDEGSTSVFSSPVYATTYTHMGTGTTEFQGDTEASIDFGENDGTIILGTDVTLRGSITSEPGVGSLTLEGSNTVIGQVANGAYLKQISLTEGGAQVGTHSGASCSVGAQTINLADNAFTINGSGSNLSFGGEAQTIALTANNSTSYGYISLPNASTGQVSAQDLHINITGASSLSNGTKLRVIRGGIDPETSIDGDITITKDNTAVRFTYAIEDNELVLTTIRGYTAPNASPEVQALLDAINNLDTESPDLSNILTLISNLPNEDLQNSAYQQLIPTMLSYLNYQVAKSVDKQFNQNIVDHLSNIREGINAGETFQKFASNEGNIWVKAVGGKAKQREIDNVAYRNHMSGAVLGIDALWDKTTRLGSSIGYANNHVKALDHSSKQDIDTYRLSLYANKDLKDYFIEGLAATTWNHYSQARSITFPGISRLALSDYNGKQHNLAIGAGKSITYNQFKIRPKANLVYTQSSVGGYVESGASDLDLSISKIKSDNLSSILSVAAAYPIKTQKGQWTPELRFGWAHEYLPTNQAINGTFKVADSSFLINGPHTVRSTYRPGLSLKAELSNHVYFAFDYDVDIKSRYRGHNFGAIGKYQF